LTMVMTLLVMFWAIDGLLDMGEGRSDATGFAPTMALRAADGKGAAPSHRRTPWARIAGNHA
jgi:hypothetical protein